MIRARLAPPASCTLNDPVRPAPRPRGARATSSGGATGGKQPGGPSATAASDARHRRRGHKREAARAHEDDHPCAGEASGGGGGACAARWDRTPSPRRVPTGDAIRARVDMDVLLRMRVHMRCGRARVPTHRRVCMRTGMRCGRACEHVCPTRKVGRRGRGGSELQPTSA